VPGAYLVYDATRDSFGAHCSVRAHGTCRLNRQCKKLPLAFLVEWLRRGGDCASRLQHKDMYREYSPGQRLGLEARLATRGIVQADPGLAGARDLEARHRDPFEPLEPRKVT
jgi:hypothetical protein